VRQNQRIAHELRLVTDRRTDRPAVTAYAALAQRRACEKNSRGRYYSRHCC